MLPLVWLLGSLQQSCQHLCSLWQQQHCAHKVGIAHIKHMIAHMGYGRRVLLSHSRINAGQIEDIKCRRSVGHLPLQVMDAIKKSDVMGAANKAGVNCTDKDYVKIMKELCISKGSNWSLRREGPDENMS